MTTSTTNPETASVFVYDDTHGWVLVKQGFPTKNEAELFADLITDFEQFGVTVSPMNVIVTTDAEHPDATPYEDVFSELEPELKSGIRNALGNYVTASEPTGESVEAL